MTLLKIIHLLALTFGAVASLGNIYLGIAMHKTDLTAPGFTNRLRSYLRYTALGAVLALWASGLLLLLFQYGGWVPGSAFGLKLVLVGILTCIVFFLNLMSPKWARSGGPPSYVPTLHWISAVCLLSIVAAAVISFN